MYVAPMLVSVRWRTKTFCPSRTRGCGRTGGAARGGMDADTNLYLPTCGCSGLAYRTHQLSQHSQGLIDEPVGLSLNRNAKMGHAYWNDWYSGWGCTYWVHSRFSSMPLGDAFKILDARYAKGEITRDEYALMKSEISSR